jgi:hypothetical protein
MIYIVGSYENACSRRDRVASNDRLGCLVDNKYEMIWQEAVVTFASRD